MEFVDYGKFIWAFALVIGLLGLLALVMRRYAPAGLQVKPRELARLRIIETLPLDPRFRLLLVRRDDVEHLIIKGPESVQVIETGILHKAAEEEILATEGTGGDDGIS